MHASTYHPAYPLRGFLGMRYTLDLSELTLIDLLDLMSQEALGFVQLDAENASTLHTAAWQRARCVDKLEHVMFDEPGIAPDDQNDQ